MISHDKKFLYVHINKCGGTSIINALNPYFNDLSCKHFTLKDYYDLLGKEKFKEYYKFAVVRNPFDKLASFYMYIKRKNSWLPKEMNKISNINTFEQFVYSLPKLYEKRKLFGIAIISQTDWLTVNNKISIDHVIKFKNINDEFKTLIKKYKINTELSVLNKNPRKQLHEGYKKEYNKKMKDIVLDVYAKDFENFNFKNI